jgi:formate dehydrogenase (coenzyme F420) beta subunit
MEDKIKTLQEEFSKVFEKLELVLGWEPGYDALHATPCFIRQAEDLKKLVWNPLCSQNLCTYLVKTLNAAPREDDKKIGICVKGCDSRSLVALIQEKFIVRERLYIVGIPCEGTVDWRRLMRLEPSLKDVRAVSIQGDELNVEAGQKTYRFPLEQVLEQRCLHCRYPNPIISDCLIGQPVTPRAGDDQAYGDVENIEQYSLPDRMRFWEKELDRCIRCYACRNSCPLCVCQDSCIAETRTPKWLTQHCDLNEKFFYHMIHAMHLAGRCTECGECARVCPVEIPVTLIKKKLNQIVKELLDYEAGIDPQKQPPLLTFDPGEKRI